jgi:hypothetical protein
VPDRHPKKEVADAVEKLRDGGWRVEPRSGHVWGRAYCPHGCCQISVNSSPQNAGNHAKKLARALERCPGEVEEDA